jgi:hypothetical protein
MGYVKIAFLPFNHSIIYDIGYVKSPESHFVLVAAGVSGGDAALLVYLSARVPEVKLGAIWIVIPLLPFEHSRVRERRDPARPLSVPVACRPGILVAH